MSDRTLATGIKELDKDISECESFLAKVLRRKAESSRQSSANKKKNVFTKNTPRPQSSGSQSIHQRAPSAGSRSGKDETRPSARKPTPTRNAPSLRTSPARPQKPKYLDGAQLRRSSSVSRLTSQGCKCDSSKPVSGQKVPVTVHLQDSTNYKTSQEPPPESNRSRSPDSRSKHLSWGEILRGNHVIAHSTNKQNCDMSGMFLPGLKYYPIPQHTYTSKLPYKCEPTKESASLSSGCTGGPMCNHFFKVSVAQRVPEESFSSEGTSGISSNNDQSSNLTNKSVQCGSPIQTTKPKQQPKPPSIQAYNHRRISSSSSGASSQKEDKEKLGVLGSDVFTIFNPVRTLHFLVKELQGMLQKHPKEDGSICRIVADMEKVLVRLPDVTDTDSSSGYTTRSKVNDCHSSCSSSSQSCNAAEKPMEGEEQKEAVLRAMQTVPALARRIDERIESMRKKIVDAKTSIPIPTFSSQPQELYTSNVGSILRLQRYMENSGHQLEIMCQTMEQTCDELRKECDALRRDIEDKDKKLRAVRSQEQDLLTTVSTLRGNLETTTHRATQLSVENKLLIEQVKLLPALQESDIKLKKLSAELLLLREEVKGVPTIKSIEEKYKALSAENMKLKEEKTEILKSNEAKVADLSAKIARFELENKNLQDTVSLNKKEIQKLRSGRWNPDSIAEEATRRLMQRLQDALKERDEVRHEVQTLKMEREKHLVLIQTKDEELSSFVKDIITVKKMVMEQLNMLKSTLPQVLAPGSISDVLSSSSDSEDLPSVMSACQPICSSPTSTVSGAIQHEEVWQDVSTIVPEQTQSSPEFLVGDNRKEMDARESPPSEFKSVDLCTWHSLGPQGQGETCTSNRLLKPPTEPQPVVNQKIPSPTENQWTGAQVVTHELHQNVRELFDLLKRAPKASSASSWTTVASKTSTPRSSKQRNAAAVGASNANVLFKMPKLPGPPKFLETPEFSDLSSYPGSLAETSSVESIDAMLKELQKDQK